MILLPSKGRPENLQRLAQAYLDTLATEPVLVILEEQDERLGEYLRLELPTEWRIRIYSGGKGAATHLNKVYEEFPDETYYGFVADDTYPRANHWDAELANSAEEYGYAYPNDLEKGSAFACHAFISGDIVRAVGKLNPLNVHHYGLDNYWFHLCRALGRLCYRGDVILEHLHPRLGKAEKDATYRDDCNKPDNEDCKIWRAHKVSPEFQVTINKVREALR